jgi:hypothetical protein
MPRIVGWTKLTDEQLWEQWQGMFAGEEEAVATAIWIANRLVKDKAGSTRRKFYSIKDEWIECNQEHLVIGKVVKIEAYVCSSCGDYGPASNFFADRICSRCGDWAHQVAVQVECETCGGAGHYLGGTRCVECNGFGKHEAPVIYEHLFDINGTHYTFHSHIKPRHSYEDSGARPWNPPRDWTNAVGSSHLCGDIGADPEIHGGRFTEQDLYDMALPISGLLRLLGYVATAKWGLQFCRQSGRYESDIPDFLD